MTKELTLEITLQDIEPRIWRRVVVPGNISLEYLHRVIQVAMGWTNSHLHQFSSDRGSWCYSDPRFELEHADDECEVMLQDVAARKGAKLVYEYDFGDGWTHAISVESTQAASDDGKPRCLYGERACPPEDVGGSMGYSEFLEVVADPQHENYADFIEWMPKGFDPEVFDEAKVNEMLADPDVMTWSEEDMWLA